MKYYIPIVMTLMCASSIMLSAMEKEYDWKQVIFNATCIDAVVALGDMSPVDNEEDTEAFYDDAEEKDLFQVLLALLSPKPTT